MSVWWWWSFNRIDQRSLTVNIILLISGENPIFHTATDYLVVSERKSPVTTQRPCGVRGCRIIEIPPIFKNRLSQFFFSTNKHCVFVWKAGRKKLWSWIAAACAVSFLPGRWFQSVGGTYATLPVKMADAARYTSPRTTSRTKEMPRMMTRAYEAEMVVVVLTNDRRKRAASSAVSLDKISPISPSSWVA